MTGVKVQLESLDDKVVFQFTMARPVPRVIQCNGRTFVRRGMQRINEDEYRQIYQECHVFKLGEQT